MPRSLKLLLISGLTSASAVQAQSSLPTVFEGIDPQGPGCVVGVEKGDEVVQTKAYGLADLETGSHINTDTIFEAGSVSKQFAAAAVLMLVDERRLSLSDDIRKYFPELPSYGPTISVAALLNHTNGLRDWGDVQDVTGVYRGEFAFDFKDVLGIIAKQDGLNHGPGEDWSYTNTGYVLAAMLVERVTGKSLAVFSSERIFEPLGMTNTQWRKDFRMVVPGRATAYRAKGDTYFQAMPFESVYGHAGLLTTVKDLLIWNKALRDEALGHFVTSQMITPTQLNSGFIVEYGMGLKIAEYGGQLEISHAGATAGYLAWLGHYPDQRLSIALLCNNGDVNPVRLSHAVADLYLPTQEATLQGALATGLGGYAGWYYRQKDGLPMRLVSTEQENLAVEDGPSVYRLGERFSLQGQEVRFGEGRTMQIQRTGGWDKYLPADEFFPSNELKKELSGDYQSLEANVRYRIKQDGEELTLSVIGFPHKEYILSAAYEGAFTFGYSTLRYDQNALGEVQGLTISSPRLWALKMNKTTDIPSGEVN